TPPPPVAPFRPPARPPAALPLSAGALSEEHALHVAADHDAASHPLAHTAQPMDPAWGVDSEYGRLLDVLLCPPDNFHWLPTSAISRATLASDAVFDQEQAKRQHAEMVSVYEDNGVN